MLLGRRFRVPVGCPMNVVPTFACRPTWIKRHYQERMPDKTPMECHPSGTAIAFVTLDMGYPLDRTRASRAAPTEPFDRVRLLQSPILARKRRVHKTCVCNQLPDPFDEQHWDDMGCAMPGRARAQPCQLVRQSAHILTLQGLSCTWRIPVIPSPPPVHQVGLSIEREDKRGQPALKTPSENRVYK